MASPTLAARSELRSVLEEGRTCWRVAPARRVAFLVDGEAYFGAVASALERARRRVWLLGWDFHTGMRLRRRDGEPDLVGLLDGLVRARRRLDVYMLDWDYVMLFALERQALPTLRFGKRTHPRLHFALDSNHPPLASHHQKLVVIDDAVAFTGGFDLTSCRWDTRDHATDDERRCDPGFSRYDPFHDVGLVFDGPAARALADLARERWRGATGQRVAALRGAPGPCPWPGVAPALEQVRLGLARTQPAWNGMPERREVEALCLASIQSARRWLYIENQYLTAACVRDALAARLREADGPEVVIVCPEGASGWLEERTMGVLRLRFVRQLREADRHGRLAVVHPVVPGGARVNVHSKVLVADDQIVRVGSSNLSNRSMGLDTELDVAIEALGDARVARGIDAFRDDLLAEHLGCQPEAVRTARESKGSLLATLRALGGGERTLRPLDSEGAEWLEDWLPEEGVLDPERAVSFEELSARVLPSPAPEPEHTRRLLRLGAFALLLLAFLVLWRFTPLAESLRPDRLAAEWAAPLGTTPWSPLLATLGIALGGALFVPITVLSVASVLVFGPWLGSAVALAGAVASAALGWGIGRRLWRDALDRLLSPRLRRLSLRLAARGVLAVTTVRIVPVAPFAVINYAAGASHVKLRDLVLGTLLGMSPGVAVSALLTDRVARVGMDPGWVGALVLVGLFALVNLARRWVHGRSERESEAC